MHVRLEFSAILSLPIISHLLEQSEDSPAGQYLLSNGVKKASFNSFGSRRGNDRIMTRGTFGNVRIKNLMVPGTEGLPPILEI